MLGRIVAGFGTALELPCVATMDQIQNSESTKQTRPLYPVRPILLTQTHGELLYAYGRLFARGDDERWHLVTDAFTAD